MRAIPIASYVSILQLLLLSSCSGGGGSSSSASEARATIGSSGGSLEVGDPNSPLFGWKLDVPPGALAGDVDFRILSPASLPPLDDWERAELPFARIEPAGTTFAMPAQLSIPYRDEDGDGYVDGTAQPEILVVPSSASDASAAWEELEVIAHETDANRLLVQIEHLSVFGLRFRPQLSENPVCVYVDPAAPSTVSGWSATDAQQFEATVLDALANGLWAPQMACSAWSVEETTDPALAHVHVAWGSLSQGLVGQIRPAGTCAPDTCATCEPDDCSAAGGAAWRIILSEEMFGPGYPYWDYGQSAPPAGALDLRSAVVHELAHAFDAAAPHSRVLPAGRSGRGSPHRKPWP